MHTTRGALLHKLAERVEQLEQRVAELEKAKTPVRKATPAKSEN
jgi:hypothetical protein